MEPKPNEFADPVYNLVPPPGVAAEFAYLAVNEFPVLLQTSVRTGADYGLTTAVSDISQTVNVFASKVSIWGVPASPAHNDLRGHTLSGKECLSTQQNGEGGTATRNLPGWGLLEDEEELEGPIVIGRKSQAGGPHPLRSEGECASEAPLLPLLTMPTSCGAPQSATLRVDSWQEPGDFKGSRTRSGEPAADDGL